MTEASKVRLVRCPKCGNLLPELPNFSLYQCGGCGAVLRAKNKEILEDGLSEVSEDGERRGVNEKGDFNINSDHASGTEMEYNEIDGRRKEERSRSKKAVLDGSSTSRTESTVDSDITRLRGEKIGSRFSQGRRIGFVDDDVYRRNLMSSTENSQLGDEVNEDVSKNREQYANSSLGYDLEEIRPPVRSRRSKSVIDDWNLERNGSVPSWRNGRDFTHQGNFARYPYFDEGPSNYEMSSYPRYGEQKRYPQATDGLDRVAHLENDRAELIKKLDELKDQISKSGDIAERPLENISAGRRPPAPPDPYTRSDAYMQEGYPFGFEKQHLPPDKYVLRPPYFTRSHGHVPLLQSHGLGFHDSYPSNLVPNSLPGHGDAYHRRTSRRPPHEPPHQYSQWAYPNQFPDYHMNLNQDPLMPQPHETFFHQPACSCSYCINKIWQGSSKMPTPLLSNLRSSSGPSNVAPYHHVNSVAMNSYSSDGSHPCDHQPLTRPPSDMDSVVGGFSHQRPRQVVLAKGRARICHPIAGGAPFITCCHCFELLKVPSKVSQGTNKGKIRCGACSSIFLIEYGSRGIILAVDGQITKASGDITHFSDKMPDYRPKSAHYGSETNAMMLLSVGHDNSNSGPKQSSNVQSSSSSEYEKKQFPQYSSSSLSDNEISPDSVIEREDVIHPAELPLKDNLFPPQVDTTPKGHPVQPQSNDAVDIYSGINKAEHADDVMVISEQNTLRQGSVKDAPVASETDISVNEYPNSGISQDSIEVSKEGGKSRINKLAGLVKRSLKDLARSAQTVENEISNILINGHRLPEHIVKKAEKVAGPIQPGDYWYDYRAGFWGVMGYPCLGIIPPKIEDFNYPLPENCSNGSTKVFVNGRELHQKDLDLLSSRGLPITRHKSYLIEISGKVVDELTGKELDSLGKLAPTIERFGHGFGMKVPKSIAQQA